MCEALSSIPTTPEVEKGESETQGHSQQHTHLQASLNRSVHLSVCLSPCVCVYVCVLHAGVNVCAHACIDHRLTRYHFLPCLLRQDLSLNQCTSWLGWLVRKFWRSACLSPSTTSHLPIPHRAPLLEYTAAPAFYMGARNPNKPSCLHSKHFTN